ncbi:MAG: adenosylcobinamide-GDP ribazoletransferase, partial [Acidimicrobiia bacterium]|nr:adenosylcobinamide-GDP ribazoletransferase [Acidimicrobiia bacterium]
LVGLALLIGGDSTATILTVVAVVLAVSLATAVMITLANRKIDGITGDVLGSVQQLSALATLVIVAAAT